MSRCQSGDGCRREATRRNWCEQHAEQLDRVAASMGTLGRVASDQLRGKWAVLVASAVWDGKTGSLHEVTGSPPTNAEHRAAVKIAERNGWIARPDSGRGWRAGPSRPPGHQGGRPDPPDPHADTIGRVPIPIRIERLRELIAERGELSKDEAARAIGLKNAAGSFVRILRRAAAEGLVISATGVVKPGPALKQPQDHSESAPAAS